MTKNTKLNSEASGYQYQSGMTRRDSLKLLAALAASTMLPLLAGCEKPAGSAADKFSFAQSVKANGKLEAQGRIIDNTQKRLALLLGLATETREGLRASFQFANGSVRANGKSHDVRDNLAYFDELINAKLYPK